MLELLTALSLVARAQTRDVYPAKSSAPTVVFVHGGAWVSGAKAQYRALGEAFANDGACAVVVDYHLAPAFKHPRPVEDLDEALRGLAKDHPARCRVDRLVLMGHSAGAHAIATWATRHTGVVKGFVGLEGIYDIPKLAVRWPDYAATFLRDEFGAETTLWPAASPARAKLVNTAPWLVVHSAGDELVDPAQSKGFADHLRAQKIATETFDPGELAHFDVVQKLESSTSAVFKRVRAFVDRVGR